jgi:hypothetical protein
MIDMVPVLLSDQYRVTTVSYSSITWIYALLKVSIVEFKIAPEHFRPLSSEAYIDHSFVVSSSGEHLPSHPGSLSQESLWSASRPPWLPSE